MIIQYELGDFVERRHIKETTALIIVEINGDGVMVVKKTTDVETPESPFFIAYVDLLPSNYTIWYATVPSDTHDESTDVVYS